MEYLFIWIICGVICTVIANNKGRSGLGWFLIGMLLGPFGIILALVIGKNEEAVIQAAVASGGMKKCPHCAELIKKEAVKCRFCGEKV